MINKEKYLVFFLIFLLFIGCSFNKKSPFWSKDEVDTAKKIEEEQKEEKRKIVKIYSSKNIYEKEVEAIKKVKLSEPKKNLSWETTDLNAQNFLGHINLSGVENNFLKKRIGKNRFNTLRRTSPPLILDDNIVFSDNSGTIYKISKEGKLIWKTNIYKKVYKKIYKLLTFSIYKNKIYIADNIGFIYVINFSNGEVVWIKNHGIPLKSFLKIFNDKIFLINQDNRLICLSIYEGNKLWDFRSGTSFIKSQDFLSLSISSNGNVLMINSAGKLYNINSNNGKVLWFSNIISSLLIQDTDFLDFSNVVVDGDDIFFSSPLYTFSFNLNNGYRNWMSEIGSGNIPIIDGNNVFLISDNGYFVNLDRISGEIIWSTNILKVLKKRKQKTKVTGFILGSNKIYATTLNGFLIVSFANSGKVEKFIKVGGELTSSPIVSDGSIYILTKNSKILGFN